MKDQEIIDKIRENLSKRVETDKIMWFSFHLLLSITTFGLALFPTIYRLIERRNKHFQRQKELEDLILARLKNKGINIEVEPENCRRRSSLLWSTSILLIAPIFAIAFLLSKDLHLHERRQASLFRKVLGKEEIKEQKINLKFYAMLTLATLGVGIVYWFYRIFNDYNNHFKEQWRSLYFHFPPSSSSDKIFSVYSIFLNKFYFL